MCTIALASAQYNPYQMWGMGMGNQVWGAGMRYPPLSWMGISPMWRSASPTVFRNAAPATTSTNEKTPLLAIPQGVINIPKVSPAEEVLTHMVLANQNAKPYDTIADMLYSPDMSKARQSAMNSGMHNGMHMNPMRMMTSDSMMDDCK